MRELDGRRLPSRVKGKHALERSMRSLLIRLHRFGQHRATDRADMQWCARAIDGLTALLTAAPNYGTQTAHPRDQDTHHG